MEASAAVSSAEVDVEARRDLLEARGLKVYFGGVHAVDGVDLTLKRGEILGLIGPNGAGKTTLVNLLTGFDSPSAGIVELEGRDITSWSRTSRRRCHSPTARTCCGAAASS